MAQQQQGNASRMKSVITIYAVMFAAYMIWMQFFAPKPEQNPQQAGTLLAQAWGKERRVREIVLDRTRKRLENGGAKPAPGAGGETAAAPPDAVRSQEQAIETYDELYGKPAQPDTASLSDADMKKRLEDAQRVYEDFYQHNKRSSDPKVLAQARQARFQEINVYDFLATRVEENGSHWYDQAQPRLKEMRSDFLGKTGSVALEVDGQFRPPPSEPQDLGHVAEARLDEVRAARDVRKQGNLTYKILGFLVNLFGGRGNPYSYFWALLAVVVVLKGATFPLQKKQYQYQRDMMRIQPLLKEVQEKMKGRPPVEQQNRIMQIYKENNVSIAGGCLPMLALAFVLLPVYWMVQDFEYQFTYGKFLWVGSDWGAKFWWIAHNLAQFDVPLFVVYLATTIIYSLMQPKPADPQQAQQQKMMMFMMPLMFGFMMWTYKWSSAFMLYWLVLNLVSMYQSWVLNRMFGLNNPAALATAGGSPGSGPGAGPGGRDPDGPKAPVAPLEPMKGVQQKAPNGKNGRRSGVSDRIRPRRTGR